MTTKKGTSFSPLQQRRQATVRLFYLMSVVGTAPYVIATPPVRLANGPTPYSGRVEVYMDNSWGTVCHTRWGEQDARIVCEELGYLHGGKAVRNAAFGESTLPIKMAYVNCFGNETSILACGYSGARGCEHYEEAGVVCTTDTYKNKTGRARLAGSTTNTSGRVEVEYNGVWGTVCRDGWSIHDSRVVCKDQGFCGGSTVRHGEGAFGSGTGPVWLSDVTCSGKEESFMECAHSGWGENECEHHSDVGIVCEYCPTGMIRLVGSENNSSGIVTISNNGVWGTICGVDTWSDSEARVVCRSLGFGDGFPADPYEFTGVGGAIWLSEVECTGWEAGITLCRHDGADGWGENDCRHYQDVAVNCTEESFYTTESAGTPRPITDGQVATPTPESSNMLIIVVVAVVVGAIVLIVVVVAVVCGVTKVKTTNANRRSSILLTRRVESNTYMLGDGANGEGACAMALVPLRTQKSHESGVYMEIEEKADTSGCRRFSKGNNSYSGDPTLLVASAARAGNSADPLPAIPWEDDHTSSQDSRRRSHAVGGATADSVDQEHYSEITDNSTDYLTPLQLKQ